MTSEFGQSGKDRLNQVGIETAGLLAESMRSFVIDQSYDAFCIALQDDEAAKRKLDEDDLPEGEQVGVFVLDDELASPVGSGERQQTISLLWILHGELGLQGKLELETMDRMKIHIPVPDDYQLYDPIPRPNEVYVERIYRASGDRERYVVNRGDMYEYETAADHGKRVIYNDMPDQASLRVSDNLALLGKLYSDITIMDVVPQIVITIGEDEAVHI